MSSSSLCLPLFLGFLSLFHISLGSKILFLIGLGTHSHRVAMQPLATKLADRGHEVAFLSSIESVKPDPRIMELRLPSVFRTLKEQNSGIMDYALERRLSNKYYEYLFEGNNLWDIFHLQNEILLRNKEFRKFVRESHYDLIVTDYNIKEVAHAVGHVMGAKVIWFCTAGAQFQLDFELLGLPVESSWLPDLTLGSPYSFVPDHFVYAYNSLSWYFSFHWYFLPKVNKLVEESLGMGIPSMDELFSNVDLIFLNEHFSFGYPRSLPPFIVPIGGMHCGNSNVSVEQLNSASAQKASEFISHSKFQEFIYISLGSFINTSILPKKFREILFGTLASFKNTAFLLKWGDVPKELPENVLVMNWFPQQEILGHPKCKGFVTQGGAISFQQAVYHGVPVIVIPAWWDQPSIGRRSAELGIGIHLELPEVTKESLAYSLNQLLYNKSYSKNMKLVSAISKDRPMKAEDIGVWWTEYVLRHDTSHLKSPGIRQRWWQRRLLDFWGLIFILFTATTLAFIKIVHMLFNIDSVKR